VALPRPAVGTERLGPKVRIIHIANLNLTLERFVEPLASTRNNTEFEHLYVYSNSSSGRSRSAINLSIDRSYIGILKSWLRVKENVKGILGAKPNIIHVHTPATAFALIPSLRKVKKRGIQLVYTARGSFDEGGNVVRKFFWHFLDPLKWTIWDGVCVVNDHLLNIAEMDSRRICKKISIGAALPNRALAGFVHVTPRAPQEVRPLRLAWVGRLDKDKRFPDFISLVSELNRSLPRGCIGEVIGAYIEGDGGPVSLPDLDNIRYHGWLESPSTILCRCDVLISTSTREGYGLVPLEAALVGTPTIAVANHGTRESVPAVGGVLVRSGRTAELLEAVLDFETETPELKSLNRCRVHQLAEALVEGSDPEAEMLDFYKEVAHL